MKKLLVAFIAIFTFVGIGSSFAQITIPVSKTITVDAYAGILSWNSFSIDSLHVNCNAGVRLGAVAVWRPSNWFAVKSMAMFQQEIGNKSWVMHRVSMIFSPVKNLNITVGNMGTLVTEQRPYPTTAGGQFETFTEAQIPGMALCAKVVWDVTKNISFGGAIADRGNRPEYQAMFKWKGIKLSGLYSECDQKFGGVLSVDFWKITEILVYRQDKVISNLLLFHVGPNREWCLYSDTGYDLANNKLVRGEWGTLRNFSSKYVKGLIGPGYCYEDRSIHMYLFVHL